MNVGVVGKGCIAKCLAHSLVKTNTHSPSLLLKSSSYQWCLNNAMIKSNECTLTYWPWDPIQSINIPETSNVAVYPISKHQSIPEMHTIVIPTKSFQITSALSELQHCGILRPQQTVILLHNGIISTSEIPTFIKQNDINLIFGTTSHPATTLEGDDPFTVRQTGRGLTWLGYREGFKNDINIDTETICNIFDSAFPPTTWHYDVEPLLLLKLAINCCVNPLTAIYQIRNDGLIGNEKYQSEMRQICTELCAVFRAHYRNLKKIDFDGKRNSPWHKLCDFHVLWDAVNKCLDDVKLNYSSMNRDMFHNRQSEIDQINGYVVALGKEYGVDMTFNERIVNMIHDIESTYLTQSKEMKI